MSSLLTTLWHEWAFRHREVKAHREACTHQWGEVVPVVPDLRGRTSFFKRWCPACGAQENVNADGSPYVPGQDE